jgi:hypothetical protein
MDTDRPDPRFAVVVAPERIVEALSEQQHLHPHQTIGEAVATVVGRLGICPEAAARALASLALDSEKLMGRLRRTELMQLGRTIHRLWRQNVAEATGQSQPA